LKQGIFVNLEPELFDFIANISDDMEWSKSQTLKKIITICKQEDWFGNYKEHRKTGRAKNKKN